MGRGDSAIDRKSGSITRPANTSQYDINDAISDSTSAPSAIEIEGAARSPGYGGSILGLQVLSSANQSTLPQLVVYVFDREPTPTNDNAEFGLTDADAANLVGLFVVNSFYDLDVTSGANGNAAGFAQAEGGFPPAFKCASGSQSLWALLKVLNAYTPVSAEIFTVTVHLLQE